MIKSPLFLNCQDNEVTYNKKNYLLRAAARLGLEGLVKEYDGLANPEYVLNIEPYTNFYKGIKWTGIWNIDLLLDKDWKLGDWAMADTVFCAISTFPSSVVPMKEKITVLFQACDPELHRRIPTITPEFDFVFCGSVDNSLYAERKRLIGLLRQSFSSKDYGKGWKPEDYVRQLNTARVQFVRSMGNKLDEGEIAQRFFECMAIGAVLTNYVPDLDHTGFVEGIDYLCYRSDMDLLEKMKYLVQHPDKREILAKNARWKSLMYHTYEHRLLTILGKASGLS